VDIVVKGRHTEVTDRFREHASTKLTKVGKLDPKVIRIDVEVCRESNPRLAQVCERVELTCRSRGPVIRAEAAAADPYAALDVAFAKLENRLRRSADRRRVHHGNRTPVSVASATAAAVDAAPAAAVTPDVETDESPVDAPFVVREKEHVASPMTLDQALFEMELVGHDFYLFIDAGSGLPSVVYRRRGYDYGVIRLHPEAPGN
jgi:ribosomal subunit interface protein